MMLRTYFIVVVAAAAVVWIAAASEESCALLHVSDFHWDPFYGTSEGFSCTSATDSLMGEYGCDAPYALIEASVDQGLAVLQQSGLPCLYAVFTGDWVRHGAPSMPNANETMVYIWQNLSTLLANRLLQVTGNADVRMHAIILPNVAKTVLPTVGNEDFNPDYHLDVNDTNSSLLRNYSQTLQSSGLLDDASAASFSHCGFFRRDLLLGNATKLTILGLNTVIYTFLLTPKTSVEDPCGQFAWMQTQLQEAQSSGRVVWIVAHVPPVSQLWSLPYFNTFVSTLDPFNSIITAQFYGHTHATSFGILQTSNSPASYFAPLFISGSITRVSKTNPTFQFYRVDGLLGTVTHWSQYYLNESLQWAAHDMAQTLEVPNLTSSSLYTAGTRLRNNQSFFAQFYSIFEGGFVPPGVNCSEICQRIVSCSTYALTLESVALCML